MAMPAQLVQLRQRATTWWRSLTLRDRRLATLGGFALALVALWGLAVQPALRTLREAPPAIEQLDVELQQMQVLAAESASLRAAPPVAPAQAAASLKTAVGRLGDKARLAIQGDRATVTVSGVDGAMLRSFLAESRSAARARPVEAQLVRGAKGYDGTLIFSVGGTP